MVSVMLRKRLLPLTATAPAVVERTNRALHPLANLPVVLVLVALAVWLAGTAAGPLAKLGQFGLEALARLFLPPLTELTEILRGLLEREDARHFLAGLLGQATELHTAAGADCGFGEVLFPRDREVEDLADADVPLAPFAVVAGILEHRLDRLHGGLLDRLVGRHELQCRLHISSLRG